MNKLIFFKLDFKRKFNTFPFILLGTLLLFAFCGFSLFFASKMADHNYINFSEKKKVAFDSEDNSVITENIIESLTKVKSLSSLFEVKRLSKEELEHAFDDSAVVATASVPEDFFNSVNTGKNLPIVVRFSDTPSLYSVIIAELCTSGERILKSAESGIYLQYDLMKEKDDMDNYETANNLLNLKYLSTAFERNSFFNYKYIVSTEDYSIFDYYLASCIMLTMLLSGIVLIIKRSNLNRSIFIKLKQSGRGYFFQSVVDATTNGSVLFLTAFGYLLITYVLSFIPGMPKIIRAFFTSCGLLNTSDITTYLLNLLTFLLNIFVLCLFSGSFCTFCYSLFENSYAAILFHFIFIIVASYISGCFIPSAILPNALQEMSKYMPTTYMQQLILHITRGDVQVQSLIIVVSIIFILIVISSLLQYIRLGNKALKRSVAHEF